ASSTFYLKAALLNSSTPSLQSLQEPRTGLWQRRKQMQGFAGQGVRDVQLACVQEHRRRPLAPKPSAHLIQAILIIAHDGKPAGGQMHAYLMRAARAQFGAQQAVAPQSLLQGNNRMGLLSVRVNLDAALAISGLPL